MTGAERIAAERQRQIYVEGYDAKHDDEHNGDEDGLGAQLLDAADCYLNAALEIDPRSERTATSGRLQPRPEQWPWEPRDWKPSDDPVRNLEKAGALIAAEIDRLLRKTAAQKQGGRARG